MSEWNFNMDEAPKGDWREAPRMVGKKLVNIATHFPVQIIAAGNGDVVTLSRWLPDEGRWNMFSKSTPPIAWMPWPAHPTPTEGTPK